MKKILFLLLLSVTAYGQVPADATPLENVQITNNVVSTGAPSVVVQETNGVINKINKGDVIEYLEFASAVNLPVTGVAGKLYLTRDNNRLYRWNGTIYVEVTVDISGKENTANKQNSLVVDGTGVKFPTVDAVNAGLATKQNTISGTTNVIPKFGTGGLVSSNITDNGSLVSTSTDMTVNGINFGRGGGNISGNLSIGGNNFSPSIIGGNSTSIGVGSLASFQGFGNLAFGRDVLRNNINGSDNIGVGFEAGSFALDGSTPITNISRSILIGVFSRANGNDQTNQIVIGHQSMGLGSNTTVIGNASTLFGRWFGRLLLGTSTDNGVDALQTPSTISHAPAVNANQGVVKSQLDLKADLASPSFTGVPLAPTATAGTNTTQIATTAFVSTADTSNVKLTGNQSITGTKTFTNSSNSSGIYSYNTSFGDGIYSENIEGGVGLHLNNFSGGNNIVSNNSATGTGFNYVGQNQDINTFTVDKLGATTATSFIKSGGTRSQFLKADGSVDESDVVKNIVKEATQGANITGTVSETILYSKLIPANTFKDGDFMTLFSRLAKSGTSGTLAQRVKINTSNTLTGAILIAQNFMVAANTLGHISRTFNITNGFIIGVSSTTNFNSDIVNSGLGATFSTFDPTVDNYIFITGQLANSADTMYHLGTKITN